MDAKHGRTEPALNARPIIISTKKESAAKLNPNAKHLMSKSESAKDVIRDIKLRMESVFFPILLDLMIKDAKPGIMEFALNALLDGILDQITSATQLTIYAEPGTKQPVPVKVATEVTLSMAQNVSETQLIYSHQLILYAPPGRMENAKNALKELISIMESAIKLVTSARLGITSMENA